MAESWRNRKTLILSWSDMVGLLTPAEYDEIVGLRAGWRENETQKRARAYGRSKMGGRTGAPVEPAPAGHEHHD